MTKKKKNDIGCPSIAKFRLDELVAAEYNPRTISDEAMEGLGNSIRKFGCVEPIVVNVRGGKNVIVGGHQRFRAPQAMGEVVDLMCVTVDCSKADEKLLNLTLNNQQIQGRFIKEIGEYIENLRTSIPEQDVLDLRIAELQSALGGTPERAGNVPDDDAPKPAKSSKTTPGDMWILGEHRLLCGDSTVEADVERLMDGKKASLFATDPPYCIDYTGAVRPSGRKDWSELFDEKNIPDAREFIKAFYSVGLGVIKPKTALYLWHAEKRKVQIREVCGELKILIHQNIVWVKPCTVLGYSFYSWRHEPCLLMWKQGSMPPYRPRDKSIGTVWPVGFDRTGDPTTPEYYTDIWEVDYAGKKKSSGIEHPTVKPVELFAIPMRVHTNRGDICYEPFCGSGTQIIAAEKLSRKCFAMEKEPVFVDVAVKRWEQWSGRKATLEKGAAAGGK
ncbi:MAG: DNA methyltransferase [Actinomycetota bacterium]|nr:DNA methyltransferase [Actinomycetota bacterium]